MITTRPATSADVAELHPGAEGTSYRAWTCDLDGKPAGVVGLALTRPRACLFCSFDETLRPYLKSVAVLRLLKKAEALFKARNLPVYTIRDKAEPKAPAILARLGFEYLADVEGDEVWGWSPQ